MKNLFGKQFCFFLNSSNFFAKDSSSLQKATFRKKPFINPTKERVIVEPKQTSHFVLFLFLQTFALYHTNAKIHRSIGKPIFVFDVSTPKYRLYEAIRGSHAVRQAPYCGPRTFFKQFKFLLKCFFWVNGLLKAHFFSKVKSIRLLWHLRILAKMYWLTFSVYIVAKNSSQPLC